MQQSNDEAAIRAVVQSVENAWNAGDGDAFAAPFAEDADYVIVDGRYVKGRETIAAGHRRLFDTVYKGSNNTFTIEGIRFVRPDVALARVRAHLKLPPGYPGPQEAQARSTWVLAREDGQWQVVSFQNTPVVERGY